MAPHLTSDLKEFWLGSVFRTPFFRWTGKWFQYNDGSRNVHERTVKVWELYPGPDLDQFLAEDVPTWTDIPMDDWEDRASGSEQ